jgi:MFS transporter, AAHS family, 4-hydroxybenzoate transporter
MTQAIDSRWSKAALLVVGFCFFTNMVDGIDVNIMSYVRGALSKSWHVPDDSMGYVFSAGTFGMGIGALGLAPLADTYGRKALILFSLILMSLGMLASGVVPTLWLLIIARFVVGMGIGTVLATMAALAAEAAPIGKKDMAVGVVQAGFPLAAVATGFVAAAVLPSIGWQKLLLYTGYVTLLALPLAWAVLPRGAAARAQGGERMALTALFEKDLAVRTLLLVAGVSMGLMVLYSMLNWITKLASSAGLSDTDSIYAGASYNFGAFVGTIIMGFVALRVKPSFMLPIFLSGAAVSMLIFGFVHMSVAGALFMAFCIGVSLQGGYNAMWPLAASAYPQQVRATGVGWVMGIGRAGAVVGPVVAGKLLDAHLSLGAILAVYCLPLALCALCAYAVGRRLSAA